MQLDRFGEAVPSVAAADESVHSRKGRAMPRSCIRLRKPEPIAPAFATKSEIFFLKPAVLGESA